MLASAVPAGSVKTALLGRKYTSTVLPPTKPGFYTYFHE